MGNKLFLTGDDVMVARDRLKGALEGLVQSDEDSSSSLEETPITPSKLASIKKFVLMVATYHKYVLIEKWNNIISTELITVKNYRSGLLLLSSYDRCTFVLLFDKYSLKCNNKDAKITFN